MNKVFLSLTTIPSRLNKKVDNTLQFVLNCLENLSYENYEVHLNIPFFYNKTGEEYQIPDWLIETNKLRIFRTEDYGPATKLVPTVKRLEKPESTIIVLDDDLSYENDFIEYHLNKRKLHPNAALGFAGLESKTDGICYYCTARNEDIEVNILEGYKTVSFQRSFFKNDFETFILENMSWDDDMLVSAYLAKENIPRIVISTGKEQNNTPRADSYPVKNLLKNDLSGCEVERIKNTNNGREKMEKYFVQRSL
jgi:hypothetical protein